MNGCIESHDVSVIDMFKQANSYVDSANLTYVDNLVILLRIDLVHSKTGPNGYISKAELGLVG